MSYRLPPFAALRAFEAVARRRSVGLAADELSLTPGAISHQVKSLEDWLGIRLLRRQGRGIAATDAGARLAGQLAEGLTRLATAVEEAAAGASRQVLRVSVLPSFAARWLMPRLPDFMERRPDIELRMAASARVIDLSADEADLALRYGLGHWPDTRAEKLMDEVLFPVCGPSLLAGRRPETVADWLSLPILEEWMAVSPAEEGRDAWTSWLRHAGSDVAVRPIANYDDSSLLLQAAAAGQGVALGRSVLTRADLESGRLVRLPGPALPCRTAYWLVRPARGPSSPAAEAFAQWLHEQVALFDTAAGPASHG